MFGALEIPNHLHRSMLHLLLMGPDGFPPDVMFRKVSDWKELNAGLSKEEVK